MTRAQLYLDGYHPALFAAHFSHFGLLCFRIDQDCGFMPKTRGEFLNRLNQYMRRYDRICIFDGVCLPFTRNKTGVSEFP